MDINHIPAEVLQAAVASKFGVNNNEIEIKSFKVKANSIKGGNMCIMKATEVIANIKGEEKKVNVIAKCLPQEDVRALMLLEGQAFKIETVMYTRILPALRKIDPRLSTPMVFYANDQHGVILMEDLTEQNYFLADTTNGLNAEQVKLVLKQLAILHATSYHFIETYPNGGAKQFYSDFPELSNNHCYLETSESMKPFNDLVLKLEELFIAIIEEHCKDIPKLVDKLRVFASKRKQVMISLHAPQGDFNCILHNDAWTNNFMFRKSSDEYNVKILDFQRSRIARPTIDVVYLLATSTTPDFRKKHLEELLQFYHYILIQCLEDLGHSKSVYSYEQLKKDFADCYPYGFSMSHLFTMVHMTPADDSLRMDEAKDENGLADVGEKYRDSQLRFVRENAILRNRLILIAMEAEEMGVI